MRVSHALIVTLALMVSPAAAAVCEVVCGMAPHAAHQAVATPAVAVDEHAHHGHHPSPTPAPESVIVRAASPDDVSVSIPAPECDLRGATPARLRPSSTDVITSSAAITTSVYRLDHVPAHRVFVTGATSSPPARPPLTPLPLRI